MACNEADRVFRGGRASPDRIGEGAAPLLRADERREPAIVETAMLEHGTAPVDDAHYPKGQLLAGEPGRGAGEHPPDLTEPEGVLPRPLPGG